MCIMPTVTNKIVHRAYCLSFWGVGVCSIFFEILIVRDDLSRVHFDLPKLYYNALSFWKLLVFEFQLGSPVTSLCSMSALSLSLPSVVLLGSLQLLIKFTRTMTYLEMKQFLVILFYNGTFLFIKILIVVKMNTHIQLIYFLSLRIVWRACSSRIGIIV